MVAIRVNLLSARSALRLVGGRCRRDRRTRTQMPDDEASCSRETGCLPLGTEDTHSQSNPRTYTQTI